ncbi:MAG: helix-turn-helix transcriptional regulator [Parvibaculum sp.]|nr:helix-turn-helix transcriptional regulator [Parvibaculum sp.]
MTKAEQAEIDNIFGAPLSHFPLLIGTTFDTTKKLGEAVRAVRTSSRLSQQELADMAGVGRRFVSELENGKATLEIGRVLTVCQALGIDILARKR